MEENNVISVKTVESNGKKFNISFGTDDYADMVNSARIARLNGYSKEAFVNNLSTWIANNWSEFADKAWEETKNVYIEPMVTGATEILWSDRRAKTVVAVVDPKTIVVMENEVKCDDYYAGNYTILPELTRMAAEIFTLRKGGGWYMKGQPKSRHSVKLVVGYRDHYIDPNF